MGGERGGMRSMAIRCGNENMLVEPYQAKMATGYGILVLRHLCKAMHSCGRRKDQWRRTNFYAHGRSVGLNERYDALDSRKVREKKILHWASCSINSTWLSHDQPSRQ